MSLVYDELRNIAGGLMRGERVGHTMQPTELIHEAYLRIIPGGEQDQGRAWSGRVHFRRIAARAMRHVLIDHARARRADKRGGGGHAVTLDTQLGAVADDSEKLLFVHDGLEQLATIDEQLTQIVELRFFGGMTMEEIAESLDVSKRTVERGWRLAKAWWASEFSEENSDE